MRARYAESYAIRYGAIEARRQPACLVPKRLQLRKELTRAGGSSTAPRKISPKRTSLAVSSDNHSWGRYLPASGKRPGGLRPAGLVSTLLHVARSS